MLQSVELEEYIRDAIDENEQWLSERNMTRGEWAHCMFHFVRKCRFHPSLRDLEAMEAAEMVEEILCRICESEGSPQEDPWCIFRDDYSESSWDAFIDLWDKVKYPVEAEDPLALAATRAERNPVAPKKTTGNSRSRQPYLRFLSIAAHLQYLLGPNEPIALPVVRLAEILEVTRQRVGQMRGNATTQGFLVEWADYKPPSGGKPGTAAKYLVKLDRIQFQEADASLDASRGSMSLERGQEGLGAV